MIYSDGVKKELAFIVKEMKLYNKDGCISILGNERSGKSTLALNIGRVLDSSFTVDSIKDRVCFTFAGFAKNAPNIKPLQTVIFDESGEISRRKKYGTQNRAVLKYLQECGGQQRFQIFVYPDITEIDPKIISRSQLFFETIFQNGKYIVKLRYPEQIKIILNNMKILEIYEYLKEDPGEPLYIFRHDLKNIEDLNESYLKLKSRHLDIADQNLSDNAMSNVTTLAKRLHPKIIRRGGKSYSIRHLRRVLINVIDGFLTDESLDQSEIYKSEREITIRTLEAEKLILSTALNKLSPPKR